jgi:hypothetical protein
MPESASHDVVRDGDILTYKDKKYIKPQYGSINCVFSQIQFQESYEFDDKDNTFRKSFSFTGRVHFPDDFIHVVGTKFDETKDALGTIRRTEIEDRDIDDHEGRRFGRALITSIGFDAYNWEWNTDEIIWIEFYAPASLFDEIINFHHQDKLHGIHILIKPGLWIPEIDQYAPPAHRQHWYMFPEKTYSDGQISHEIGRGYATAFSMRRKTVFFAEAEQRRIAPRDGAVEQSGQNDAATPVSERTAASVQPEQKVSVLLGPETSMMLAMYARAILLFAFVTCVAIGIMVFR